MKIFARHAQLSNDDPAIPVSEVSIKLNLSESTKIINFIQNCIELNGLKSNNDHFHLADFAEIDKKNDGDIIIIFE